MESSGKIVLENALANELTVCFEPEADECELRPGEAITLEQSFTSQPATVKVSLTPEGRIALTIWPGDGKFTVKKAGATIR